MRGRATVRRTRYVRLRWSTTSDADCWSGSRLVVEISTRVAGLAPLETGHQIATDSKGNIYIAATGMGMQKLTYKGMSTASR